MDIINPKTKSIFNRSVNQAKLKAVEVPLTPLPKQKKIAHNLPTVPRGIVAHERISQTTTELTKPLMHKRCTESRRHEPQKPTETGPVPESWEVEGCEDVCNTISIGIVVKPSSYYEKEGVPALRSQNIREDRIQPEPIVYISEETNNGLVKKSKLPPGDVLIVRTDYPGASFGLAQQDFKVGAVKNTQMPLSPADQQDEIVSHFELIDAKHDLATSKRNALQDLFHPLLHELMTAKTRVHKLEITA
jgi:type I restriction enzyme S subunit